MRRFSNRLSSVKVASPCTADWDSMLGSDRVRFCGQCQLNVYNLSAMSKIDAEALITRTEGRLCIRFYRRNDGSIITQDCPVGWRAIKRRASRIKTAVASVLFGFLAGIGGTAGINRIGERLIGSDTGWVRTQGVMAVPLKPPFDSAEMGRPLAQGQMVLPKRRHPR